jgi:hypothetical protein
MPTETRIKLGLTPADSWTWCEALHRESVRDDGDANLLFSTQLLVSG